MQYLIIIILKYMTTWTRADHSGGGLAWLWCFKLPKSRYRIQTSLASLITATMNKELVRLFLVQGYFLSSDDTSDDPDPTPTGPFREDRSAANHRHCNRGNETTLSINCNTSIPSSLVLLAFAICHL